MRIVLHGSIGLVLYSCVTAMPLRSQEPPMGSMPRFTRMPKSVVSPARSIVSAPTHSTI